MKDDIFQKYFQSPRNRLNSDELPLTRLVFDVAFDEINPLGERADLDDDTKSVLDFEDQIEATMAKFDCIIKIFDASNNSRDKFMRNYDRWSKFCAGSIKSLKVFADEMQTDKLNSDIAKLVGGVVGTIGTILVGLSFLTPLASVTVPLAIAGGVTSGLGGGVIGGTGVTELVLVKNRLDKVKDLIEQEKKNFEAMASWFACPADLENAINDLLSYDALKDVTHEIRRFLERPVTMTDDEFRQELKSTLKFCIGEMNRDQVLTMEYGKELAPVVITFAVVVCLLRTHNLITLNCAVATARLALDLSGVINFGVLATSLLGKLAGKGVAAAMAKFAIGEVFVCLGAIVDILNVVTASIDIHKKADTVHTKKIKEATEQFENIFMYIERVYNETKKYKTKDETEYSSVIINHVPVDADIEDIKAAVKPHIPEDGWRHIRFRRLKTKGNNWMVRIPEAYDEELMKLEKIKIKEINCKITQ